VVTPPIEDQPELPKLDILMLEDSKYNAFVIQTYLQNSGCTLTIAENGTDGVELFKNNKYDIVLMDIQMPEMDGYQATQAIREWESSNDIPRTPIIAMTAYAQAEDAQRCLDAGTDSHVAKPVKKSALFDRLKVITGMTTHTDEDTILPSTPQMIGELKGSIIAAYSALEQNNISALNAIGTDLSSRGRSLGMETIAGYGDAITKAVEEESDPEHIRQILGILSEYVERLDTA